MSELSGALGLPLDASELLEEAADELSFGARERARELCDRAIERIPSSSHRLGAALYLRGLASEGETRLADLREAVAVLATSVDPSREAEARLALADVLALAASGEARVELERAGRLFEPRGELFGMARVKLGLARVALAERRYSEARRLGRSAIELLAQVETSAARRAEVGAHELIGDAAVDPGDAIDAYREAIDVAERSNELAPRPLREKIDRLRARRGPFR